MILSPFHISSLDSVSFFAPILPLVIGFTGIMPCHNTKRAILGEHDMLSHSLRLLSWLFIHLDHNLVLP